MLIIKFILYPIATNLSCSIEPIVEIVYTHPILVGGASM
jgi:hypothetical protein